MELAVVDSVPPDRILNRDPDEDAVDAADPRRLNADRSDLQGVIRPLLEEVGFPLLLLLLSLLLLSNATLISVEPLRFMVKV